MIRDELYQDALNRLHELAEQKVVFVSDGTPGGDKVASLVHFARSVIPDMIKLIEQWFDEEGVDPELEHIRFQLAMDLLSQPIDQGMLHLMESFRRAVE